MPFLHPRQVMWFLISVSVTGSQTKNLHSLGPKYAVQSISTCGILSARFGPIPTKKLLNSEAIARSFAFTLFSPLTWTVNFSTSVVFTESFWPRNNWLIVCQVFLVSSLHSSKMLLKYLRFAFFRPKVRIFLYFFIFDSNLRVKIWTFKLGIKFVFLTYGFQYTCGNPWFFRRVPSLFGPLR